MPRKARLRAPAASAATFTTEVQAQLGEDHLAVGHHERAEALLQDALASSVREHASANPSRARILLRLGRTQLALARAEAARPHLVNAEAFWRDFEPNHRRAGEAAFWLASVRGADVVVGHTSVRRFLRGHEVGLMRHAVFGAGFARLIAPVGVTCTARLAVPAGGAFTMAAMRMLRPWLACVGA